MDSGVKGQILSFKSIFDIDTACIRVSADELPSITCTYYLCRFGKIHSDTDCFEYVESTVILFCR